jgi:hypothetical protein
MKEGRNWISSGVLYSVAGDGCPILAIDSHLRMSSVCLSYLSSKLSTLLEKSDASVPRTLVVSYTYSTHYAFNGNYSSIRQAQMQ